MTISESNILEEKHIQINFRVCHEGGATTVTSLSSASRHPVYPGCEWWLEPRPPMKISEASISILAPPASLSLPIVLSPASPLTSIMMSSLWGSNKLRCRHETQTWRHRDRGPRHTDHVSRVRAHCHYSGYVRDSLQVCHNRCVRM